MDPRNVMLRGRGCVQPGCRPCLGFTRSQDQQSEVSLTGPLVPVKGPGSIAPRLLSRCWARPRGSSQRISTHPPEGVRSVQA